MKKILLQAADELVTGLHREERQVGYICSPTQVAASYSKVQTGGSRVIIGKYDSEIEIQLWYDQLLGRDCFWFGFNAPTMNEIKALADVWDGSYTTLVDPECVIVNGMTRYKDKLTDDEVRNPVLENYRERGECYFGLFDGRSTRTRPAGLNMRRAANFLAKFLNISDADQRKKVIGPIAVRQGSKKFRKKLLNAYKGECAITGCPTEAVLDAIHIVRYRGPHSNKVSNGMILRTDLHTLFDLNLLSLDVIDDRYIVRIAKAAKSGYGQFDGKKLNVPSLVTDWPSQELLREHRKKAAKI